MSIPEYIKEVKGNNLPTDLLVVALIIGTAVLGFGLGALSGTGVEKGTASIITSTPLANTGEVREVVETKIESNTEVYASRNGKRYYYAHCGGLGRIKAENKVAFSSPSEAESRGYTLASGCNP